MKVPVDEDAVRADAERAAGATPGWYAPDDVTEAIVDAVVPWLAEGRGALRIRQAGFVTGIEMSALPRLVPLALRRATLISLTRVAGPEDVRQVWFDQLGQVVLAEGHRDTTWRDDVASLAEPLVRAAPVLEQGLIRDARMPLPMWSQVVNQYPPLPPYPGPRLRGTLMVESRHLAARYVHDAYGVQLVTGAHLAAVRDLSGWHAREVAPDRFLVEARDTAAWFAGEEPDPAVLAAARSDFGAAILTPETFATEPPPPWW